MREKCSLRKKLMLSVATALALLVTAFQQARAQDFERAAVANIRPHGFACAGREPGN